MALFLDVLEQVLIRLRRSLQFFAPCNFELGFKDAFFGRGGRSGADGAAGGGGRAQFEVETLLNLQLFFILLIRLFLKFLDLFGYFLLLRDLRLPSG